jgi:transcriptional regulator with XRE-family HTH domain
MATSSIAKQIYAGAIGAEIRRRRMQLGLTQQASGQPFTRQFVSLVEQGRVVPSIASLLAIARNLETSPGALLDAADRALDVAGKGRPGPSEQTSPVRMASGGPSMRRYARRVAGQDVAVPSGPSGQARPAWRASRESS